MLLTCVNSSRQIVAGADWHASAVHGPVHGPDALTAPSHSYSCKAMCRDATLPPQSQRFTCQQANVSPCASQLMCSNCTPLDRCLTQCAFHTKVASLLPRQCSSSACACAPGWSIRERTAWSACTTRHPPAPLPCMRQLPCHISSLPPQHPSKSQMPVCCLTLMGFTLSPMRRMFWLAPTRPALTFSG